MSLDASTPVEPGRVEVRASITIEYLLMPNAAPAEPPREGRRE
jgi:hypothetical protein